MKVLILGATGSIGRHVVEQALQRGHQVTVLARDPKKVVPKDPRIQIVEGKVLDPQALDRAVVGQEAVIYAIGADSRRPTTLFSDSTRLLIAAMEKHGVRRLVCITGIGAGDSRGHGGFLYDRIIYPLFTKNIYRDKDR
jgi:putative NADH-flavin reductase